ncbi:MAG: YjjG family noncanonical pyrimidine nucleotidase [Bacteroidetes bacterium]|nr:YjjG family noncanonical pyrimidine nucleotidase [Bacteroidota bacterium]
MGKTYKHVFFDLDHTLWDFEGNSRRTLATVYDEFNLAEQGIGPFEKFEEVYNVHNENLWARFRNGFIKREELRWKRFWFTLLDFKIGDSALANELSIAYLDVLPTQKELMPNAKEILDYCAEKYPLHLITNGFEATQWQKLRHSGIETYFKEIITSEKSQSMKPQAAIFDYALKACNTTAEDSIMIGDALDIDILGAFYAGWDQVYFNPDKKSHNHKPTYEIADLIELKTIL